MANFTKGIGAALKNEAEEFKSLQTKSLCYSIAKPTL